MIAMGKTMLGLALMATLLSTGVADEQTRAQANPRKPDQTGKIVAVAGDGQSITLEASGARGKEPARLAVRIGPKTRIVYFDVGPGEAKLAIGHFAQIWLADDTKDLAARVAIIGGQNSRDSAPDFQGLVSGVLKGGKGITLEVRRRGQAATKKDIPINEQTEQTYFNVKENGASPTPGYYALVFLAQGKRAVTERINFIRIEDRQEKERRPDSTGILASFAKDGKSMTLEIPGARGQEAKTSVIKIGTGAKITFHNLGPGGATPAKGYSVQLWLEEGSKDTAVRVKFFRAVKSHHFTVSGKVGAVAADGKGITLIAPVQGGSQTVNLPIKITGKTKLIFNGVVSGGDRITTGYSAEVAFEKDSKEIAARITFTGSEK
jgi:hypothetical protein